MAQKFIIGGTIGYGNSYMEFLFRHFTNLDYMQNYMTLLEQCDHIVVKVLAIVPWLDEDEFHVWLVTWLDYKFAFT